MTITKNLAIAAGKATEAGMLTDMDFADEFIDDAFYRTRPSWRTFLDRTPPLRRTFPSGTTTGTRVHDSTPPLPFVLTSNRDSSMRSRFCR